MMMSGKDSLLEKPRFELAVKGVFRLGRCRAIQVFGPATGKARLPTVDRLTGGTRRRVPASSTRQGQFYEYKMGASGWGCGLVSDTAKKSVTS